MIEGGMPHAVVLDLALPRLGGREVLKELRANAATHKIPVIVVTGTDHADIDPAHFACVLKKPISPNALIAAVEKCVANWRP